MPIDNNKLKKVWDTLRNGGYTQDYKTFVKGFSGDSNYENRKKVYDLLTENGAQIGKDYGEFMSKLHTDTPIRRAPQPKPTPTVKNPLHLPEGFGTVDLKDPMAKVRDANEVSDAVRGIESGNAEKAAAGRKKLAGVSARLEKEREAAKPAMDLLSAPLTEEQKSYVRHRKDAADYQAETGRKMPSVFGAGFERFGMLDADDYTKGVAPARIFVPEAERDEKGRITGRYSITSDKGAQRADRDARQGAIDRLKTIDAEEAEKERLSTTEGKDAEIADTESRIKELDAKMAARRRKLGIPQGGGTLSIAMNVAANADEEYNALSAARRQEELRLRSLKDRRFGGNDDYWWQIYRGAQGAVEKFLGYDTASDLAKYRAAGSASGFDKGVDEARQMFMEALDKNEREQAVAAGSGGLAREFGQLTGNSAIYMLPFMFGGKVIGGIQTLSRAAMRGAVKTAAGQAARKGVASALGRYTKRALGAVAEDMAIGLTGASTVGMPATLGQAAENYAGKLEQDENGRYYYTGGDDTAHAFVTALLSNSFEYSSEMAGEHMESLWKAGKKSFAKTRLGMSIDRLFAPSKDGNRLVRYYNGIKSGAEAWLERLRKTKAGSAAYNAADFITEGGARMFRHAHIQDLPFEGLEEELNNIENAAFQTGQGSWKDVADNEQRWKLWAGLAISMATTGAVFGGISTVQYGGRMAGQYRAKHLMDRADVLARYRMTEEVWKPIKDGLDNADNADIGTVIAKALGTVKTDEERKEILNYARRLLEYRGYNIATTVGAAQGDGGADAGDMAYSEGYETTDANDMHNIKTRYEEARRKVEADGVNPDGTDVRTHIEMMLGARNEDGTPYYTDEEVQPYIDYLNAKAAFDGSLERVRDDIDSGVAESEAAVDRRTGKDGMVHPAVMKQPKADGTERSVYILAGNVEFTGDGGVVIDPKDTRGSIVVCGEDGTMEMVSPDAIREVGDAIDPETEKEEAAEAVRQRIAQDAADKFDNTPKYGVNDTFVMTGADGTPVSGVVQRVSEDGIEAAVGGRVALIPTEQFEAAVQEVRDAYGNVSWRRTPEDAAEADVQENGENVPNTTENVPNTTESVPNTTESVQGTPGNAPQDLVEEQKPEAAVQENGNSDAVGRSLSESETETVISEMKSGAQAAPEMELNPKNWLSQFGEDGVVTTPIGNVKMGENQYFKLAQRGRDGKLGMVKPTLETPDVIVEDSSKAKENGAEERPSSYVFVKTFTKADGSRYYHFTSVTVSKDGGEVVVSNQEKSENRISRLLRNGRIVWIDAAFSLHPTAQDRVSVPLGDSNRLTPTDSQSALLGVSSPEHSAGKDTEQNSDMQAEGGENASALSLIPKDANGEPVYTAADAYTAWDALVEQCGGDAGMAQGVADSMVKDMETALKKAEKSAPAHGVTVAEKIAAAKGHKAAVEKARTELEKWRAIAGETASRARAAEEAERRRKKERLDAAREELRRNGRYAKEDAALGDYTDFADYAMRTIATGKYRFLWGDRESGTQGLGAHLGFTGSRTERNKRIWLLSKDGFTPEEAAERMLADYSAAAGFDSVGDTGIDSMEALDMILDILRRYTSPRAMMDDAKSAHAENGESAEERRQREEYERGQFMEAYHMTPEEYYEYENEWLPRYMEEAAQVPQEVIDNINAEYAEKYSENGKDDYNGGEDARGVPPVQGERLDKPGGDEGGGDTGGAAGAVGEGDAAGGFVPQGASGREVRAGEVPQPVGKGAFGDIYDQFRGDAKAAFDFLTKHRSGDLLGVFHRDDTGDIDLVWGDENSGLSHILTKHVGKGKDFGTEQAAFDKIESILKNGKLIQDGRLRYVVSEDGYRVAIRKDYDGVKKNWIVTAVDYNRSKEEKEITTNPTSASHGANGPELAAPNNSKGKVTEESADLQENGGKDAGGKAEMPLSEQIDAASAEVNTEPTEAQKEAGNYKKGHVQVGMFDITIEQPEGSIRRGTDADGKQWEADQTYIHNAKPKLEGQIKAAEKRAEEANAHLLAVQKAFPDGKFTEITVGKQKFGSVDAMADFIKEHNKKILDAVKAMKEHPSNAAQTNTLTLSLGGYDFVVKTDMSRETQNIGGSLFAEIHRKMTYSCPELGLTDIPVKQSLLRNAVEDITENVITGKDFAERFDIATRMVKHGKSELEQLKQREGKPFEFGKELEEAKRQFEEYSEAMKVEMAEKEKKYAEMDASVEAATDVAVDVEDDTPGGDAKFRSMEMDVTDVADEERDAMTARVNELAERLHTPVRIIRTDEEVAALPSIRQRRMKGSFNPMTGEVTIVVPNNANMADVENTFLHEVVGHDGLRGLFPEEEKLNNALDELYRVSKDGIQDTIDRMARKMYDAEVDRLMRSKRREHEASGGNADAHYFTDLAEAHVEADRKRGKFKRDATEEYGADLAGRIGEKGFEKMSAEELTFWGRLKAVLQNALRKLAEGLGIPGVRKWGDNEWAFVLHEAYKRKRNGGKPSVADAADTVAARESSGFDGELYRVGDVKTFRDGRGIEFRRKPTATFNALLAHLEKEGVKTERHKARTGSEYASFSRYGVMYEVRNADHTKAKSADRRAEESGVEVTDWDGMIRHIDMDLVQARMNAADVYALMDEAERFNSEDEAVRRAATEDGVGSAEFRDAYPTLWRVMGLKSPEEARMEHLRKKYADEYYTARGKELDKLYPFTASNGVTIGRGRKFRVPKSIVYGKGDARRAAEEEFDKAYKKVYDEFIPLDDFVRQREQEGNLEEVNRRFNEQLQLYRNGEMDKNEMLRLGRPQGVMRAFLPNLPIVMRQRILTKGSVRKHNVSVEALANMPTHLAHPIFVFKRSDNALGVLTEMQDRDGKNICVAIELNRQIQNGGEILEVNDIRSVHGRNVSDIVYPIVQNGTLEWADKEKGLAYLSSASRYVQQEIDKQDLDTAAKVVENFENPKVSDEKASDEDLMFRDGDNAEYNKALARDIYERRVSRGLFQTQEALQDSMLGLKEAMDAILKAEGKGRVYIEDVAGFENAYLGENRLSSVNQAECSEFGQRLFKPLLKEAARLAKTAEERAELTDYMMAKHGLERNEVMARRDARKKAREELAKELAKAEKSADKNAVADVKQRMKDRENELYKENRKRDYAGLTALTGMPYVGDAEDEARRMVADYEREHAVKTLWDRVNAVNAATLLKSYESGMISRETYDDIRGMYKNYIPLRGFDEKTAEDAYAYVSSEGRGGFNAPIRTAKGRKSKADDPFANMEAMAESAIMQGNRNVLVKQRFMNFAVNHPSDLVSISDLWLWKNDATGEWQPLNAGGIRGTEAIGEDDTPAEVARKMRDFEAAVEQAAKDDPEHFRRQKENPAVPYRVVESRDLRQHQVIVRRNGRDYVLTINGNPRAAQALNGLTNPDNDISGAIGKIMRFGEKVNRELSAFYTTRNPDFVVSNFLRDMMYANTMVWVKETPNYAVRFHMNVLKLNPAKMKLLLAKFRKGTLNDKDETERMFRQFMMNGGETGYSSVKDIDRRKNDIRRELKKYNGKIPLQGAYTLLGERLDEYNRAVENCARFAAFMTSRQMMRSIDRSVYDAKEISVNFNKKGSGAKFIDAKGQTRLGRIAAGLSGAGRSLYVFFNAAIQGTANYARQFRRHPVKALTGAAVMYLLGTLMAHIGGSGDDDDEKGNSYWDLPEWTRRSNIMFRAGGQWVCIPLPVEYRVFYGMGELAVSAIEGREQLTPGELASAVAAQLSQALPIDLLEGGGGLSNLMPSIVKPGVEAYTNTSWTGLPIYRKNDFNKNDPEWTKAYRNTNKYLVAVAEKLNEATGGDKYTKGAVNINPAQVEYLLNGYFGGVSGTVDKLVKSAETLAGQREYDPRSFLLLNRIVKKGDERTTQRAVNNEYARLEDKFDALGKRLRGYRHDTTYGIFDFAEKANFIYNSPEYMEMMEFNACKKAVDKCRTLIKNSASPEDAKGYEEKINGMKRDIVERLGKTKRPAARAGAYIGAGAFYKAFTEAKMKEAE